MPTPPGHGTLPVRWRVATRPAGSPTNLAAMRLSARVDYALRAAAELASVADGADSGPSRPVTAEQIARSQDIPPKFLESILLQLRRGGIVHAQRGPEGGYWLARAAAEISLAEVIRVIDGPLPTSGAAPRAARLPRRGAGVAGGLDRVAGQRAGDPGAGHHRRRGAGVLPGRVTRAGRRPPRLELTPLESPPRLESPPHLELTHRALRRPIHRSGG